MRKNDYWAEGEKEERGEWIGEGAKALGLEGPVTDKPFDALRQNRHPQSGEPLTPPDHANRAAFFDIQLFAPKDVNVLVMVGGDDRVRDPAGPVGIDHRPVLRGRLGVLGRAEIRTRKS